MKDEVCNLIIDNGSCKNIMFRALVKLEMNPHHHSYAIEWIKEGPGIKVTNLGLVPISISKYYQDCVACDVIDMDKCHIFWRGHGNMMLTLFTKEKRIYICSLGRAKKLP